MNNQNSDEESFFKKVAESTLDPIIIMNNKGEIFFWNKASEKFFGYTSAEVMGKMLHKIILPKGVYDVDHSKNLMDFFMTGDSPILDKIIELSVINKKNELLPIELSVSALKIGDDTYAVGTIRDISTRKKVEDELKMIFDSVPAWIFYKDLENRFIRVNSAFTEAMGKTKAELEGKSLFDLYPKEQAEKFWLDDKEIIKTGKSKVDNIEIISLKDKTSWVKTDKIPYFDANHKIIGVIGFSVDITIQKDIMDKLTKNSDEIMQMNRLMVGRETKMVELKEEIALLKKQIGLK